MTAMIWLLGLAFFSVWAVISFRRWLKDEKEKDCTPSRSRSCPTNDQEQDDWYLFDCSDAETD